MAGINNDADSSCLLQEDDLATERAGVHLFGSYLAPLLIIFLCVAILQYHSIIFWNNMAGTTIGWLWSATIEVIGLWFWLQKSKSHHRIGLVASVILLSGPLFLLGADLVHQQATAKQAALAQASIAADDHAQRTVRKDSFGEKERILKEFITTNNATIRGYTENSKNPLNTGWSKAVDAVMERNKEITASLFSVYTEREAWQKGNLEHDKTLREKQRKAAEVIIQKGGKNKLSFITYDMGSNAMYFLVSLQMLALILLQTANVIAMMRLGSIYRSHQVTRKQLAGDANELESIRSANEILKLKAEQQRRKNHLATLAANDTNASANDAIISANSFPESTLYNGLVPETQPSCDKVASVKTNANAAATRKHVVAEHDDNKDKNDVANVSKQESSHANPSHEEQGSPSRNSVVSVFATRPQHAPSANATTLQSSRNNLAIATDISATDIQLQPIVATMQTPRNNLATIGNNLVSNAQNEVTVASTVAAVKKDTLSQLQTLTASLNLHMEQCELTLKEVATKSGVAYRNIALIRGYKSSDCRKPSVSAISTLRAYLEAAA